MGEQTCDKLKKSECIHSLSSLQNGRLAFAEGHAEREKLHVQERPEGCLLLCSVASKTSEVHPVLLGRSVIRIPLSMFWSGTSSTNFYKATENPNSNSTKNQNSGHRLPGRYALNEPNNRKPGNGKEHIDFSLTGTGVHNKSEKISTVGNPETRILGPRNKLSKHDSNIANGKSKKFDLEIQKTDGKSQTNVVGNSSLIGSLCSTAQAVMPAFLPIRYLQQQQVEYTKKQFSYHSIVHLNQNSIQELIWWVNNLEILNGKSILSPINRTIIQADASQKGCWHTVIKYQ